MRWLCWTVVLVGCVPQTGMIAEVQGPAGTTSTAAGVATLEYVVAHQSWCDRWVQDASASRTRVSVAGRDLDKRPYDLLVAPSHQTDLTQPVYIAALAYSSSGALLGEALFGEHPFSKDAVLKREARIELFPATVRSSGGPEYVSSDGCVCVPGQPWVGTGTGTGCDTSVVTSFARLGDTAGCELTPKGAPLPVPRCDGQQFLDEPADRDLPCWAADASGTCRMTTRRCADHDGIAWTRECTTDDGDFALPTGSMLCQRYLACEHTACGDVTGCFEQSFGTPLAVTCTLRIDPTTTPGQTLRPCSGTVWTQDFPGQQNGQSCVGAVVQGVDQPPFTIGFAGAMAQATTTSCPLTMQIDAIDAPYPMAVPPTKTVDFVLGDHLVRVTFQVELACKDGEASLTCRPGAP